MQSNIISESPLIKLHNGDNIEFMKSVPDNYYDIAVVDPPYGLGFGTFNRTNKNKETGERYKANKYHNANWDDSIPTEEYFTELMRISKNQIIWGGNYFPLPPTQCFLFWYKQNPVPNFADGEFAWTSFKRPALCFDYKYYGNIQGNTSADTKIHPTQKPVQLYSWIYEKFAKDGYKILDTHLGSGNSAIAAYNHNIQFDGIEINEVYYNNSVEHISDAVKKIHHPSKNSLFNL